MTTPITWEIVSGEILAEGWDVGLHQAVYEVNGCSDTMDVVIHPESLDLSDWVSCSTDSVVALPNPSQGSQWTGAGVSGSTFTRRVELVAVGCGCGRTQRDLECPCGVRGHPVDNGRSGTHLAHATACKRRHPVLQQRIVGTSGAPKYRQWPPPPPMPTGPWTGPLGHLKLPPKNWGPDPTSSNSCGPEIACEVQGSWPVEISPQLEVALTASDSSLCPGAPVALGVETSGGLDQGQGIFHRMVPTAVCPSTSAALPPHLRLGGG